MAPMVGAEMNEQRCNRATALVFAVYSVLAALVWLGRAWGHGPTPVMAAGHLVLAWWLVARSGRSIHPFFFWLMWFLAWSEIGWLYRLTDPVIHDSLVLAWDRAMFSQNLNESLAVTWPWNWFESLMGWSYLSYYFIILGPPLVLGFRRRWADLRFHTFALLSVYLACFAIYLVWPVIGPRAVAELAAATGNDPAVAPDGLVAQVMHVVFAAGDSLGTAFPSSHCAASVTAAVLMGRFFGRGVGLAGGVWAGLIVVATVHTNNHYAIDSVAGIALAGIVLGVIGWWLGRPEPAPAAERTTPA